MLRHMPRLAKSRTPLTRALGTTVLTAFIAALVSSAGASAAPRHGVRPSLQRGEPRAEANVDAMPSEGVYLNSDGSPVVPLLKNAKRSIDMEIYTMKSPTIRRLLRDALARGVQIRVVAEPKPLGAKCKVLDGKKEAAGTDCGDEKKLVSEIKAAGGSYVGFNKEALCGTGDRDGRVGCFQHGKMVLVDGVSLISTGNLDSTNLCLDNSKTCNRDFSIVLRDPRIYQTLQSIFVADLKGTSYDVRSKIPQELESILTVSPYSEHPILEFINSATETLEIEAQYLKEPKINEALVQKSKAGVNVSIVAASACSFGFPKPTEANRVTEIYSEFDQAGITSRMFNKSNRVNGKNGYMHAKVMVADGKRAWLGSENGSTESITRNREFGVVFENPAWVKKLHAVIRADQVDPNTESWEESLTCAKDR